ncbi:MAG: glycoside hydrolase family 25 protein [Parasporobacterium sp.]|nr:glycoside hydrolase family 25 protein [Parasporobacterium sp.]
MEKRYKNRSRTIYRFIRKHPIVPAAASVFILAAVILTTVISCSAAKGTPGTGIIFKDDFWKTDSSGFRYYDCEGYTTVKGIDVSEWVGNIDFNAVRNAGAEYVIIRVGYRGYVTGAFVADVNLDKYLKDASTSGLKIGLYFVSQAVDEQEAIEEAEYCLKAAGGYDIEMPVYIDMEPVYDTARTDHLSRSDYTRIADAFCRKIEDAGLKGGIYANEKWFDENLDFTKIRQYDIWLAKYSDTPSTSLAIDMWQYSCEGNVAGAEGLVDLNARVIRNSENNGT